jgi:hypothetical protein
VHDLTLTLRVRPRGPLDLHAYGFDLVVENTSAAVVEFETPSGWDLDVPGSLEHSSDSQGELWIRRSGEPDPGEQRYSCTDVEFEPERTRLEAGARLEVCLGAPSLPPGEYEARVRLYRPEVSSGSVRFRVGA